MDTNLHLFYECAPGPKPCNLVSLHLQSTVLQCPLLMDECKCNIVSVRTCLRKTVQGVRVTDNCEGSPADVCGEAVPTTENCSGDADDVCVEAV